jgi:hypothetical protein
MAKKDRIKIEEQKDLIRKARQHLEEEKAKFEEQVGQSSKEKEVQRTAQKELERERTEQHPLPLKSLHYSDY